MATVLVESLRAGDVIDTEHERVTVTRSAWGQATGYREVGAPRIVVHVYATVGDLMVGEARHLGMGAARHLSWPSGTSVELVRRAS